MLEEYAQASLESGARLYDVFEFFSGASLQVDFEVGWVKFDDEGGFADFQDEVFFGHVSSPFFLGAMMFRMIWWIRFLIVVLGDSVPYSLREERKTREGNCPSFALSGVCNFYIA